MLFSKKKKSPDLYVSSVLERRYWVANTAFYYTVGSTKRFYQEKIHFLLIL